MSGETIVCRGGTTRGPAAELARPEARHWARPTGGGRAADGLAATADGDGTGDGVGTTAVAFGGQHEDAAQDEGGHQDPGQQPGQDGEA